MTESIVILTHAGRRAADNARKRVVRAGAHVRQQYGPEVLIVEAEPEVIETLGAKRGVAGVFSGAVPPALLTDLDETGKLGVVAWNERQSAAFQQAKQERPGEGLAWDHPGHEPEGRQEP
jgi:hypothetical protein